MALHGMIEWILALLGITVLAHLLIHIGLRAPRIRETGRRHVRGCLFAGLSSGPCAASACLAGS